MFERAGRGLRQRAGRVRAVPLRGHDGGGRERRGRAEDGADIVRIGDLVEHQHHALRRQVLDRGRGQRIGFEIEALMHGVGQQPLGDRRRPHDFRLDGGCNAFVGQAPRGVLGGEQLAHAPRRILQRGRHRVPAIHHDRAVGVGPQAVAAGALEALAPLDLLAGGARFGAGTRPAGGGS